jgi:hypothetical protein
MALSVSELRTKLDAVIKEMTPPNKITPTAHNGLLHDFIDVFVALAASSFGGLATTSTDPGTPSSTIFYICDGPGTYTNFDNTVVTYPLAFLIWDGASWDLYEYDVSGGGTTKVTVTVDLNDGVTDINHNLGTTDIVWMAREYTGGHWKKYNVTEVYSDANTLRVQCGEVKTGVEFTVIG